MVQLKVLVARHEKIPHFLPESLIIGLNPLFVDVKLLVFIQEYLFRLETKLLFCISKLPLRILKPSFRFCKMVNEFVYIFGLNLQKFIVLFEHFFHPTEINLSFFVLYVQILDLLFQISSHVQGGILLVFAIVMSPLKFIVRFRQLVF